MEEITTFVVYKENTFGFIRGDIKKTVLRLWVMAVDYICGGDPFDIDRVKSVKNTDIRVANLSDFNHFCISSKGYVDNPCYVFDR